MDNDAIRAEIERLRSEIRSLEEQKQAIVLRINPKVKELGAWEAIAEVRKSLGDEGVVKLLEQVSPMDEVPLRPASAFDPEANNGAYGDKSRAMRTLVLFRGGVTMKELRDEAKRLGAKDQFAYQWVNRQRKARRLEKRGKKFFATEALKSLTETSNTSVNVVPGEGRTSNTHLSPVSA